MLICPECLHEWLQDNALNADNDDFTVKHANGNLLHEGESVIVIKVGAKVKNIQLADSEYNVDCKITGIGAMKLKSQFVKKI